MDEQVAAAVRADVRQVNSADIIKGYEVGKGCSEGCILGEWLNSQSAAHRSFGLNFNAGKLDHLVHSRLL